jgi:hypothetical protein
MTANEAHAQTTATDHTFVRAGNPQRVAPWARPSQTSDRRPGYVGGAAILGGEGPAPPSDGVFGYDSVGHGPYDRVFLGWLHSHSAPPPGPYRTDTRRVFDVFSIHPVRKAIANDREGGR